MWAYVINLDNRPDRWKQIQKEFKGSSIHLRRISAVKCSSGGLGNILSFLKVLKLAKKNKFSSVLILEDDCLPVKGWEDKWLKVKKWLDSHEDQWDIYAGGAWGGNNSFQDITDFFGYKPTEIAQIDDSIIFKYPFITHGGHWTYYHKKSYDIFIRYFEKIAYLRKYFPFMDNPHMDYDPHRIFFKTISSYPFIAYQQSSYSNLKEEFVDREKLLRGYEKRVGRHLTRKNCAHKTGNRSTRRR
jgi:hypothetical protein